LEVLEGFVQVDHLEHQSQPASLVAGERLQPLGVADFSAASEPHQELPMPTRTLLGLQLLDQQEQLRQPRHRRVNPCLEVQPQALHQLLLVDQVLVKQQVRLWKILNQ
jgi:hypothetical protein